MDRRISSYLVLAFGISWAIALVGAMLGAGSVVGAAGGIAIAVLAVATIAIDRAYRRQLLRTAAGADVN